MSEYQDPGDIQIESSLPRSWEQETSFNDVLYDWMSRAPWLAVSAAAHLVFFLILSVFPWEVFRPKEAVEIQASIEQAPEEVFEDPPEEEPEEIEEEEPIEEPILKDAEVDDHNEDETDVFDSMQGDPDFMNDSPFDDKAFNDVIGIGGGAGGKFGGRMGGKNKARAGGGSGTEQALKDGLEWLKNHQSPDGSWDTDGYNVNCMVCPDESSDGGDLGQAVHDVGVTGLALLAFLGDGHTTRQGLYKETVTKGVKWLRDMQDPDEGLIGEPIGDAFLYDHSIATLAICEAYYFSKSPLIRATAQKAVRYVESARNPYGVWRYDVPPIGENDTSVTGWMIFALKSAETAGIQVDPQAFLSSLGWIDEVTDPATGRVGYMDAGSESSRIPNVNDHYPASKGEALTAVGLLCRFFMDQDPDEEPLMKKHAELLAKKAPEWDPDGFGCDMYYWYYGTYAMYQMGGTYWERWNKSMKKAVVDSQRQDGDFKGSWDPVGPWGFAGGRVYSTALMTLCLEVYFRYAKVLGAR